MAMPRRRRAVSLGAEPAERRLDVMAGVEEAVITVRLASEHGVLSCRVLWRLGRDVAHAARGYAGPARSGAIGLSQGGRPAPCA